MKNLKGGERWKIRGHNRKALTGSGALDKRGESCHALERDKGERVEGGGSERRP